MSNVMRIKDTRILYLNGAIDNETAMVFNTMLLQLDYENPEEDITVYINSPGGSVLDGFSMIDVMNLVHCDVRTVCVGIAASMGAMLLMAGTHGKRDILLHSKTLLHQPLATMGGGFMQASDIEIQAEQVRRTKEEVFRAISGCTGQPLDKVAVDCDRDFMMDARESLEYGIVDRIIVADNVKDPAGDGETR